MSDWYIWISIRPLIQWWSMLRVQFPLEATFLLKLFEIPQFKFRLWSLRENSNRPVKQSRQPCGIHLRLSDNITRSIPKIHVWSHWVSIVLVMWCPVSDVETYFRCYKLKSCSLWLPRWFTESKMENNWVYVESVFPLIQYSREILDIYLAILTENGKNVMHTASQWQPFKIHVIIFIGNHKNMTQTKFWKFSKLW